MAHYYLINEKAAREAKHANLRTALKGRGFRWAPSVGAWQRQLTRNAMYDARAVIRSLEVTP